MLVLAIVRRAFSCRSGLLRRKSGRNGAYHLSRLIVANSVPGESRVVTFFGDSRCVRDGDLAEDLGVSRAAPESVDARATGSVGRMAVPMVARATADGCERRDAPRRCHASNMVFANRWSADPWGPKCSAVPRSVARRCSANTSEPDLEDRARLQLAVVAGGDPYGIFLRASHQRLASPATDMRDSILVGAPSNGRSSDSR